MNKIIYNEQSVEEAKKNVEICNNNIIEALKNIDKELSTINQVISTPKINKTKELLTDFYSKKISFIEQERNYYNNIFNTIITDYHEYVLGVDKIVGDQND